MAGYPEPARPAALCDDATDKRGKHLFPLRGEFFGQEKEYSLNGGLTAPAAVEEQGAANVGAVLTTARQTEMAAQKLDRDSGDVADEASRSTIDAGAA